MARKVCIIGTTPSAAEAPYDDESWEIWGVSTREEWVTRATRWFELHSFETEDDEWVADWKKKLERWTKDCELYDLSLYPIEEVKQWFGTYFLTSTVAWMIALAIYENEDVKDVERISDLMLWGVDLEHGDEYRDQRAGVKHFIELAKFAGIAMHIDGINGIAFDPVPYPMWQDDPQIKKIDWRETLQKADLKKLQADLFKVEQEIFALSYNIPNDATLQMKRLDKLHAQLPELNMAVAGCAGQLRATQWSRNLLKP